MGKHRREATHITPNFPYGIWDYGRSRNIYGRGKKRQYGGLDWMHGGTLITKEMGTADLLKLHYMLLESVVKEQ